MQVCFSHFSVYSRAFLHVKFSLRAALGSELTIWEQHGHCSIHMEFEKMVGGESATARAVTVQLVSPAAFTSWLYQFWLYQSRLYRFFCTSVYKSALGSFQ